MKFIKFRRAPSAGAIAAKGGSYSFAVTAVVLAILTALNVLVCALPSSVTKYDISSTNLYSVTSSTKVVVNALEKDVTIYWVVQADEEDGVIENLLERYESLSSRITVVRKNPDVFPTFTAQYTDEAVPNNSLIVECGDKSRYISYNDIYKSDVDYTNYSYVYSFDGEGAITSAIDYVVSEELPKLYMLEGHGEAELPDEFREQIEKENMELETFSLLNADGVPEDADAVLIYSPADDISADERDMLIDYLTDSGKLLVMAGPTENGTLTNLYGVLKTYGVTVSDGFVIEGDREHYAFRQPYILLPDIASDTITDPLIEGKYYAIMPLAQGLTINADYAVPLLTTSDSAFSKSAGYALDTYEKEEGDTDGPFAVAVRVNIGSGGQIVWFSSGSFLEEIYNAYSSGANLDLAMNSLSSLIGEREAVSIRSKSLSYNYLTISDSEAAFLKMWMIGMVPLAFVLYGVVTVIDRRKKRHA